MANESDKRLPVPPGNNRPVKNPVITDGVKKILIILIILIIVGLGGFLYVQYRPKNNDNSSDTADQIRQSFSPPSSTSPTFTPPAPGLNGNGFAGGPNSSFLPTATSTPQTPQNTNPSQPAAQPQAVSPRDTQAPPASPAAPMAYQNGNLGFAVTLPGSWVANDAENPNRVVFFDRNTGQIAGYVEVYDNASGDNLDSLAQMLYGSPSVSGITDASVSGLPAIQYSAARGYTGGIATISGGRIYYLHGSLTDPAILSNFKFL